MRLFTPLSWCETQHHVRVFTRVTWRIRVLTHVTWHVSLISYCRRTGARPCTQIGFWTLQHTASHCNTLQQTATHGNTLQYAATYRTHCNIPNPLQRTATPQCQNNRRSLVYNDVFSSLNSSATRCNTLQHTATHWNMLHHTATRCNTLQDNWPTATLLHTATLQSQANLCTLVYDHVSLLTATHCNRMQHTATHRDNLNSLQHTARHCNIAVQKQQHVLAGVHSCVFARCSTLLHTKSTATHCNTLQHTATHCNTLQHTALLQCKNNGCSLIYKDVSSLAESCQFHPGMLQCVAVCCSVLRCVAVCCDVLQSVAVSRGFIL